MTGRQMKSQHLLGHASFASELTLIWLNTISLYCMSVILRYFRAPKDWGKTIDTIQKRLNNFEYAKIFNTNISLYMLR
jgi:hypothetical protein